MYWQAYIAYSALEGTRYEIMHIIAKHPLYQKYSKFPVYHVHVQVQRLI